MKHILITARATLQAAATREYAGHYDPNQARDKDGKWTSHGHTGKALEAATAREAAKKGGKKAEAGRHHALQLAHEAAAAIKGGGDHKGKVAELEKAVTALRIQHYHATQKGAPQAEQDEKKAVHTHFHGILKSLKAGQVPEIHAHGAQPDENAQHWADLKGKEQGWAEQKAEHDHYKPQPEPKDGPKPGDRESTKLGYALEEQGDKNAHDYKLRDALTHLSMHESKVGTPEHLKAARAALDAADYHSLATDAARGIHKRAQELIGAAEAKQGAKPAAYTGHAPGLPTHKQLWDQHQRHAAESDWMNDHHDEANQHIQGALEYTAKGEFGPARKRLDAARASLARSRNTSDFDEGGEHEPEARFHHDNARQMIDHIEGHITHAAGPAQTPHADKAAQHTTAADQGKAIRAGSKVKNQSDLASANGAHRHLALAYQALHEGRIADAKLHGVNAEEAIHGASVTKANAVGAGGGALVTLAKEGVKDLHAKVGGWQGASSSASAAASGQYPVQMQAAKPTLQQKAKGITPAKPKSMAATPKPAAPDHAQLAEQFKAQANTTTPEGRAAMQLGHAHAGLAKGRGNQYAIQTAGLEAKDLPEHHPIRQAIREVQDAHDASLPAHHQAAIAALKPHADKPLSPWAGNAIRTALNTARYQDTTPDHHNGILNTQDAIRNARDFGQATTEHDKAAVAAASDAMKILKEPIHAAAVLPAGDVKAKLAQAQAALSKPVNPGHEDYQDMDDDTRAEHLSDAYRNKETLSKALTHLNMAAQSSGSAQAGHVQAARAAYSGMAQNSAPEHAIADQHVGDLLAHFEGQAATQPAPSKPAGADKPVKKVAGFDHGQAAGALAKWDQHLTGGVIVAQTPAIAANSILRRVHEGIAAGTLTHQQLSDHIHDARAQVAKATSGANHLAALQQALGAAERALPGKKLLPRSVK